MSPQLDPITPRRGCIARAAVCLAAAAPAAAQCTPTWSGLSGGTTWDCKALAAHTGEGLPPGMAGVYVGGGFATLGGVPALRVGVWDGWRTLPMGPGLQGYVEGMGSVPAHPGGFPPPGVYIGGHFDLAGGVPVNQLARWLTPDWFDVGGGVNSMTHSTVFAVRAHADAAPVPGARALYVGGIFDTAGGIPVKAIARWDGASWSALGAGLLGATPEERPVVWALQPFDDDGPGPRPEALYVGGRFRTAGGVVAWNIARWDGATWEALGPGWAGIVLSLCVFDDDGPGPHLPALYAGANYNVNGQPEVRSLGRWDGTSWSPLPAQLDGAPMALAVFDDDGPGPNNPSLFAGGNFTYYGTTPVSKVARFDGQQWHPLGSGLSGFGSGTGARAMAVYDEDGPGPNPGGLYVGGYFYYAGNVESHHVARWGCPLPPRCDANCSKDFHPVTGQHILNVFDFGCFQARYVMQDPYADCNQDAAFTVADFGCFQTKFVAGCP